MKNAQETRASAFQLRCSRYKHAFGSEVAELETLKMTTRTCSVPSHAAAMKGHGAAHLQQGGAKTEARQHLARRLALRVERAAGGTRAVRNVAGNSEVGGNTVYAARRCCGYY